MAAILPGANLGILGGGQLGRMMAMAARTLGYHVRVLDPDPSCAARFVVDACETAAFDDAQAAGRLARDCDVVTLEIEKISLESLREAARFAPLRPRASILAIVQDRAKQKTWLDKNGFDVGPYEIVKSAKALEAAAKKLGKVYVKAAYGGYDGRGQAVLEHAKDAHATWKEIGAPLCVAERALTIEAELSVLVARTPSGKIAVYPPALNHHEDRILQWSVLPAPISEKIASRATSIAREMADALRLEGVLVAEFFLTSGKLLVNELAPRPHNSYHASEVACLTSQFEQAVRAVCDLPLGSTECVRPVAIFNLLGDLWKDGMPKFHRALELPGVRLHLYGKREARPGRKMGHLSAAGKTPDDAVRIVKRAARLL